jgi:hypothetical protein
MAFADKGIRKAYNLLEGDHSEDRDKMGSDSLKVSCNG